MARSEYVHLFKRRREGKTDYRKRRGMIIGTKPFLAVRISNKYVSGQIVKPSAEGDHTLVFSSSRDLQKNYGWKGGSKNLPAAYLTGYALGKSAEQRKIGGVTVYSGVSTFVHGSRVSALLSGAKDAGLNLEVNEEALPTEERTNGSHIGAYASKLETEDNDAYSKRFSRLAKSGIKPSELPNHFAEVKSAIDSSPSKFEKKESE
jgi:large subunit ribosomal protein L18